MWKSCSNMCRLIFLGFFDNPFFCLNWVLLVSVALLYMHKHSSAHILYIIYFQHWIVRELDFFNQQAEASGCSKINVSVLYCMHAYISDMNMQWPMLLGLSTSCDTSATRIVSDEIKY